MEGNSATTKTAIHTAGVIMIAFFGMLAFAQPTSAATEIGFPNNRIPDGYVFEAQNSPYIFTGINPRVPSWATVTIEPGVVIKLKAGKQAQFHVDGTLIAHGTAENQIVITSERDDEYGGDSNQDGNATQPAPGDWFRMSVAGNSGIMEASHIIMRYGGKSSWPILLAASSGNITLDNAVIEHSVSHGVLAQGTGAFVTMRNSAARYNGLAGVRAYIGGSLTIENSSLYENQTGIDVSNTPAERISLSANNIYGNRHAGVNYEWGAGQLDATGNWWGHDSGPATAENPGSGSAIIGDVLYDPWIGQTPLNVAPELLFVDDEGYADDGVSPNISFKTQDVPVFFVSFSDDDGDPAQYVRLIVGDDAYAMATSSDGVFSFDAGADVFGKGLYEYHFEASDGVDAVRLPLEGELVFEVRNVPVILVPGIMGTELWKGDDKIWPDVERMVFWFLDDFMDPLAMNGDGSPSDSAVVIGDAVREPIPVFYDVFVGLIADFESTGYQEDVDLFVFPYDWRLDIRDSSQELREKIDDVLEQANGEKVNLVVHSMGGLVAKQYVFENSDSKIDKLIFVGTPHLGSPKSAKMLLFGDHLIKKIISFLNPGKMKELSRNMISVYELLPSQEYVQQIGKYFYDLTISKSYTHEEVNNYLTVQGLNSSHIQDAMEFHSADMDDFDTTGIEAYNIVGCDTATLGKIIIRNHKLLETEYGIEFVAGDGTVPFGSASAIDTDSDKTFYATGIEHATMPSQSSIKQLITQIITGDINISSLGDITQGINQCVFNGQVVSVHSPVDLHIYDASGNHVGPDENGDIELDIPGATYEQIGDNKFVFIPDADNVSYDVQLDGTGDGTFSVRVSKVEDNEVTETAYYSDIPVNESSQAQITLSTNISDTTLQVDESGLGSFEVVSVAAVLDSEESADTIKPNTVISVSEGTSSSEFTLSASDDSSGILKTEYSLDSGNTWHTYQNQVILNEVGEHSVLFRSKDRAGNLEDSQTQTIRVHSPAVIIIPAPTTPNNDNTTTPEQDRHSELGSESDSESREPDPEVLGERIEQPQADILTALRDADTATLLDYLGVERNIFLEKEMEQRHGNQLGLNQAGVNFITYGTNSTRKLGTGERAGVLYSYYEAFGNLPTTNEDWDDVVKIATNQEPSQRSASAEQRARNAGANDEKSVMMIAYGLRPENRDLELERDGVEWFIENYGRLPSSTLDWNILRSIAY